MKTDLTGAGTYDRALTEDAGMEVELGVLRLFHGICEVASVEARVL